MVDAARLTAVIEEHFNTLYYISYNILHSQADAQDAVQQGLLKAWKNKHRAHPDKLRAWLTRIVINESHNIYQYRRRVTPAETIETGRPFIPPDPGVADAIAALPEALRIPFLLKYLSGYTEKEVAQVLRVPVSTIKNRLFRARNLLKDALSDQEVVIE